MLKEEVIVKKNPNFTTFRVSGVFGGSKPGVIEGIFYVDELFVDEAVKTHVPDPKKVRIERTIQCRIVMDPVTAKAILMWLSHHVNDYEKRYGKIPVPGKIGEAVKKSPPPEYTA